MKHDTAKNRVKYVLRIVILIKVSKSPQTPILHHYWLNSTPPNNLQSDRKIPEQ